MAQQTELLESIIFDQTEQFDDLMQLTENAREIGNTVLQISQLVIDFASIERVPRFCKNRKENDVEHSFMLALGGIEIANRFFPGLDTGLVGQMALVHDFPELKTGDIATFKLTDHQLKEKHQTEKVRLPELLEELPPHLADLVVMYEEQTLPEAQLLNHLDKLLPNAVNSTGAGIEVMKEDYDVHTVEQFLAQNKKNEDRFAARFPQPHHAALHLAHTYLAETFAQQFNA